MGLVRDRASASSGRGVTDLYQTARIISPHYLSVLACKRHATHLDRLVPAAAMAANCFISALRCAALSDVTSPVILLLPVASTAERITGLIDPADECASPLTRRGASNIVGGRTLDDQW